MTELTRRSFVGSVFALVACQGEGSAQPGQDLVIRTGPRAGTFEWRAGDLRREVEHDPAGGIFVTPDTDRTGRSGAWVRRYDGALLPEWFGAVGDGRTNDSAAFAGLSRYLSHIGGGEIELRRTTYLVGGERPAAADDPQYAFLPERVFHFAYCARGVTLRGNGARLLCPPGLRFGAFDRRTGRPRQAPEPNFGPGEWAMPYYAMIFAEKCDGPIRIMDLELAGPVGRMVVGGRWGGGGWQIPSHGIVLQDNRGDEIIENVHSHHQPLDGLMIDGLDDVDLARRAQRRITNCRFEYNGRQGCSIVGGRGYVFENCRFSHTGKAGLHSAPGAGLDLEAEGGKLVRDVSFTGCEFVDNGGCGVVASVGDVSGATFTRCRIVATTDWAAWPAKPRMRFLDCDFVGSVVNAAGSENPAEATWFVDCRFSDDRRQAPGGRVFLGRADGPIVDIQTQLNVRFERCRFTLVGEGVLPWTISAIYADCRMRQASRVTAYPRGTYLGRNEIVGPVELAGSTVRGTLLVNGQPRSGRL